MLTNLCGRWAVDIPTSLAALEPPLGNSITSNLALLGLSTMRTTIDPSFFEDVTNVTVHVADTGDTITVTCLATGRPSPITFVFTDHTHLRLSAPSDRNNILLYCTWVRADGPRRHATGPASVITERLRRAIATNVVVAPGPHVQ